MTHKRNGQARRFVATAGAGRGRARGAVLLLVLILVAGLFVVGMGAITSASRDTQSSKNYAAYAVALQAAQSGVEVARRRLAHPMDRNTSHGDDWVGTGGFDSLPDPTDGLGSLMGAWYDVQVTSDEDTHTVLATGRAVVPGGNPNVDGDVLATRTIRCVFERPKIEIPYAVLDADNLGIYDNVTVKGDIHANGNVIITAGGRVEGNVTAVGWINNMGTVTGTLTEGAKEVFIPKIVYYGYRPSYDYDGEDHDAVELGGTSLASDPPGGLPNNPDNVFYSDQNEFTIKDGVKFDPGTMVAMYDLTIRGEVLIRARKGMPSMIVNDDLILTDGCDLKSEGMLKIRDSIKGSHADAPSPNATWVHKGPVIFESGGYFSPNLQAPITIKYKADRVSYQPVGNIVLPLPMLSYTEDP